MATANSTGVKRRTRVGPPPLPKQVAARGERGKSRKGLWLCAWALALTVPTCFAIHVLFTSANKQSPFVAVWVKLQSRLTSDTDRQGMGTKKEMESSSKQVAAKKSQRDKRLKRDEALTSKTLFDSYKPDKLGRVSSQYTGKAILLTGMVRFKKGPSKGKFLVLLKGPADDPSSGAPILMGGRISCVGFLNDLRIRNLKEDQRITVEGLCTGLITGNRTLSFTEVGNVKLQNCRLIKVWTQQDILAEVLTEIIPATIKQLRYEAGNELAFNKKYQDQYVEIQGVYRKGALHSPHGKIYCRFKGRSPLGLKEEGLKLKVVGLPRTSYRQDPYLADAVLVTSRSVLNRMIASREAKAKAEKEARVVALENELIHGPLTTFRGQRVFKEESRSRIDAAIFCIQFSGRVLRVSKNKYVKEEEPPYEVVLIDKQNKLKATCIFTGKHKAQLEKLKVGDEIVVAGFSKAFDFFYTGKELWLKSCIIK